MGQGVSIELDVSGIKELLDSHSGIQKMIDAAQAAGKIPGAGNPRGMGGMSDSQRVASQAARDRIGHRERQKKEAEEKAAQRQSEAYRRDAQRTLEKHQRMQERQQRDADRLAQQQTRDASRAQRQAEADARRQHAEERQRRRSLLGEPFDDYLAKFTKFNRALFFFKETLDTVGSVVEAVSRPFREAADASREIGRAALLGGGGSLSAVSGAAGMGVGGAASAASSFRGRLSTDPFAAMAFGGIVAPSVYGGNQNDTVYLRRAIEKLAGTMDDNTRILKARQMGIEGFLGFSYASNGARGAAYGASDLSDQFAKKTRTASESSEALREARSQYDTLSLNYSRNPAAIAAFEKLQTLQAMQRAQNMAMARNQFPEAARIGKEMDDLYYNRKKQDQDSALKENTRAMEALSGALKTTGMTIGGPRTQGGIPPALRSLELERNFEADKVRLGGYTVR